jgi:predicted MarR family transcription regulator
VLHNIAHRAKPKTLADICLVLNVEDTHVVAYALKKLERQKLIKSGRRGKEKQVMITPEGEAACRRYAAIREELLVKSVLSMEVPGEALSSVAARMRALSGHYDQASRSAASL